MINSIGYGGAERVLGHLLSSIPDPVRHEIHLILLDREEEVRPMPGDFSKHVLDGRRSLVRSTRLLLHTLKAIRPHLVVSFLVRANVAACLAGRALGIPTVICERMHLSSHLEGRYSGGRLAAAKLLPRIAYRYATIALGVSRGVTDDLVENFGVAPKRARTIGNPYDLSGTRTAGMLESEFALPDRFIVAAGRLEPSKNFSLLIEAFMEADLACSLIILGEGSERQRLEAQVAGLGAQSRIFLPGYARNPFAVIRRSWFFAASSRNEGFPNAMVEAMSLGKPVVVSDCPSGPAEILDGACTAPDQVVPAGFGILVTQDSLPALIQGMRLMATPDVHSRYAALALKRAGHFDKSIVAEQYWQLFDEIADSTGATA